MQIINGKNLEILKNYTDNYFDAIVTDPFCGSGTTGIACKLEGFEFVGIEQDAEYCKIAEARIENYQEEPEEPLKLIEESKSKITQTTMF